MDLTAIKAEEDCERLIKMPEAAWPDFISNLHPADKRRIVEYCQAVIESKTKGGSSACMAKDFEEIEVDERDMEGQEEENECGSRVPARDPELPVVGECAAEGVIPETDECSQSSELMVVVVYPVNADLLGTMSCIMCAGGDARDPTPESLEAAAQYLGRWVSLMIFSFCESESVEIKSKKAWNERFRQFMMITEPTTFAHWGRAEAAKHDMNYVEAPGRAEKEDKLGSLNAWQSEHRFSRRREIRDMQTVGMEGPQYLAFSKNRGVTFRMQKPALTGWLDTVVTAAVGTDQAQVFKFATRTVEMVAYLLTERVLTIAELAWQFFTLNVDPEQIQVIEPDLAEIGAKGGGWRDAAVPSSYYEVVCRHFGSFDLERICAGRKVHWQDLNSPTPQDAQWSMFLRRASRKEHGARAHHITEAQVFLSQQLKKLLGFRGLHADLAGSVEEVRQRWVASCSGVSTGERVTTSPGWAVTEQINKCLQVASSIESMRRYLESKGIDLSWTEEGADACREKGTLCDDAK